MDIASVFEWFAQESLFAAEVATDPAQRAMWVRLALLWAACCAPGWGNGEVTDLMAPECNRTGPKSRVYPARSNVHHGKRI